MDLDALEVQADGVFFAVDGVPLTIQRPEVDALPVASFGIWLAPLDEDRPTGTDFGRREPRRVLAIQRNSTIQEIVRGTVIIGPESRGQADRTWKVDGFLGPIYPHDVRVVVTPVNQ